MTALTGDLAAQHAAMADQFDAELRDNRHCDAFAPCRRHALLAEKVVVLRHLARVEGTVTVPPQRDLRGSTDQPR